MHPVSYNLQLCVHIYSLIYPLYPLSYVVCTLALYILVCYKTTKVNIILGGTFRLVTSHWLHQRCQTFSNKLQAVHEVLCDELSLIPRMGCCQPLLLTPLCHLISTPQLPGCHGWALLTFKQPTLFPHLTQVGKCPAS